ncbi:MAG: DUF4294 domain-containing protein [Bacteroidetes bacterium]|nr:DUF4294 domain-containing protein [Bacteroidota bacterium]
MCKNSNRPALNCLLNFCFAAVIFCWTAPCLAQPRAVMVWELPAYIDENGDTIPVVFLPSITIRSKRFFKSARDEKRFNKLYQNVRRVYPLAKEAGRRLTALEERLLTIPEAKHRAYTKALEDSLKKEYKKELMALTVTQGRILIKLVDRETSRSTYSIVKEFRGSFEAFMWQSLASLFGSNLKSTYDSEEDRDIEIIIKDIEAEAYRPPMKLRRATSHSTAH